MLVVNHGAADFGVEVSNIGYKYPDIYDLTLNDGAKVCCYRRVEGGIWRPCFGDERDLYDINVKAMALTRDHNLPSGELQGVDRESRNLRSLNLASGAENIIEIHPVSIIEPLWRCYRTVDQVMEGIKPSMVKSRNTRDSFKAIDSRVDFLSYQSTKNGTVFRVGVAWFDLALLDLKIIQNAISEGSIRKMTIRGVTIYPRELRVITNYLPFSVFDSELLEVYIYQ